MSDQEDIGVTVKTSVARSYDKGERRFKHVGNQPYPEIVFERDNPRRAIGKCPNNLSDDDRHNLVNEAIEGDNGDAELPYPKCVYNVHEGAIYEAQTSDRGKHYHGYPYRGHLSSDLVAELRELATQKKCLREFERWVKDHIQEHG
ncbi:MULTISPECIES: hypothetical protein [unclassified Rhizobium]|uniref:hypothetical protein n=1 Tax=unclassified Rhizobium TaxID=2613769 RepID=UPI00288B8B9B|nr:MULTISPECIES: hypothetical protein [unclassified Rhizobium]